MVQHLRRAGLAAAWILFATMTALYAANPLWQSEGGRDFRPAGTVLAIILVASAAVLRIRLRWSCASLVGGLALIEGLALLTIGYFSGTDLFSTRNLRWLASINIYIGLPWIIGVAIGSGILRLGLRRVKSG